MAGNSSLQSALTRAPMLRLSLPFIAGLIMGDHFALPALPIGLCALLAGIVWYLGPSRTQNYERRWIRSAGLMVVVTLCGLFWQRMNTAGRYNADLSRERVRASDWRMSITEVVSTNARVVRAWTAVDAVLDSSGARAAKGRLLLTLMKDTAAPDPAVGDELLVHALVDTIDRVPDPGGFDQRAWAASYGVLHECFAPEGHWRVLRRTAGFASWFEDARERIVGWLRHSDLDARERGMVKAILLGIRDELDQDQKTAFARSGTMHVLAVSGSHVALIYGVLLWSFRKLGERRRWRIVRSLAILFVLWGYAGLTGATPSVLRATVTFTLFCIADMAGRQTDPVNSLAGAAVLLLIWDPVMLGQLSFQLSFLAVLGIALFYRPILHLWTPPNLALHYFWSLFSVSIAAQTFTTPLALLAFGAFPVWFLPANLVIVGLVAMGVYGGGALLLLHWVPVLGKLATAFMVGLLWCINFSSDLFANLPGAYPAVRIGVWQCIGLYALVLLLAAWLLERWNWARSGTIAVAGLLLLSWGWSAHERNQASRFILYDERDGLTCAVESGRSLSVFTGELDVWTARKIDRHQRAIGVYDVEATFRLPAAVSLRGLRAVFVGTGAVDADTSAVDGTTVVVLKEDGRYDPERILARYRPLDGFVLSPAIRAKHRAFLRHWCSEHGVPVHDVREQGAYVREL